LAKKKEGKVNLFDLKEMAMLLTIAGSHSYGMNTATSDVDYRGCFALNIKGYLSFLKKEETILWKDSEANEEATLYEVRKFFGLASQCNPNIIEILFCRDSDVLKINKQGELLRENRGLFLSQKAHHSFTGYARSQLKRIMTHKAWLDNPVDIAPKRSDFGLQDFRAISVDQMGAARALVTTNIGELSPWLIKNIDNSEKEAFYEGLINIVALVLDQDNMQFSSWLEIEDFVFDKCANKIGFDQDFVALLKAEKKYMNALTHYNQYQNWKKTRNQARAQLEANFGYDTKHAAHLVRLLRMGEEILLTGEVNVYRDDRKYLLDIKNGIISYDEIISFADSQSKRLDSIVRENKSLLPEKPDLEKIDELLTNIICM
jgi:predicted nucleotidyltransferase